MKSHRFQCAGLLGAVLATTASGQVTYRVTDLGSLNTGGTSEAFGLNENGQVTGESSTGTPGLTHAFVWLPAPALGFTTAGMKDLDPGSGLDSFGHAINLEGRITGRRDSGPTEHAFLWQPGPFLTDLGSLAGVNGFSEGWGISDGASFIVVGESQTPNTCDGLNSIYLGFKWQSGPMTALPAAGDFLGIPNDSSTALAVNASGATIGGRASKCGGTFTFCGDSPSDAASWNPGAAALAQPPGFGDGAGAVLGVNSLTPRQVAGWGKEQGTPCPGDRGLLWTLGSPTMVLNLHTQVQNPPAVTDETRAEAINDNQNVVGQNVTDVDAVLWQHSGGTWSYVNLQDRIHGGCGWNLQRARDINNAERITGWGFHNGARRAFLLTPLGNCPWDTNGDGVVDTVDFLALLQQWGACQVGVICTGDNNGDCVVDSVDFLALLEHWGPCPSASQGAQGAGPESAQGGSGLTPQEAVLLLGFDSWEAYQAWALGASESEMLAFAQVLAALLQQ